MIHVWVLQIIVIPFIEDLFPFTVSLILAQSYINNQPYNLRCDDVIAAVAAEPMKHGNPHLKDSLKVKIFYFL